MQGSRKIVLNTVVLYAKLIITIIIGLLTTRYVLKALGETDFGIYTLVGGVVGMLGILQSAMSVSSMRFMSYNLASDDEEKISKTFNTTLFLHIIIGVLLVIVMEVGGYFMFEYLIKIPIDKVSEARIVFHFMVLTTFVSVISVPYDAVINSHEDILILSIVDVLGSLLTLLVAIYLTKSNSSLLVVYGVLLFVIQLILRIIKQIYSSNKYKECKIKLKGSYDSNLVKSIMSFTWWNLFGSLGGMFSYSLRGIIMNTFFGVRYNAAEGIAQSAEGKINMFSTNLTRAINPQLVKSEGSGDRSKMLKLTETGTKFSTFLFALIAIPIFFEMPYLFELWLKDVPDYAVLFCRIMLVGSLIEKLTFEITNAIRAVGDIKVFQVTETTLNFFATILIPLLLFKLGYPVYYIFYGGLLKSLLCIFERLYFGKKNAKMDVKSFIRNTFLKIIAPVLFSAFVSYVSVNFFEESLTRFCITTVISLLTLTFVFYIYGMNENERQIVQTNINKIFKKTNYGSK